MIPDEQIEVYAMCGDERALAVMRIRKMAEQIGVSYINLIAAARTYSKCKRFFQLNPRRTKEVYLPRGFWQDFKLVCKDAGTAKHGSLIVVK